MALFALVPAVRGAGQEAGVACGAAELTSCTTRSAPACPPLPSEASRGRFLWGCWLSACPQGPESHLMPCQLCPPVSSFSNRDLDMELREEAWSPGPLDSEDQQMASHENPGKVALLVPLASPAALLPGRGTLFHSVPCCDSGTPGFLPLPLLPGLCIPRWRGSCRCSQLSLQWNRPGVLGTSSV